MDRPSGSTAKQTAVFFRNFFRHPRMLGSVAPSSRFLVDRLLAYADWDRARTFVEYGPGVGNFTGEILRRMDDDANLVVLETNRTFVDFLRKNFDDDRLHVVHRSASDVGEVLDELGLADPDYVLSGIPFSLMSSEVRGNILERTHDLLESGGTFLVYQFSPVIVRHLKEVFPVVRWGIEPRNLPPAFVLRGRTA